MKIVNLFSGAGGFGLGAKRAGFDLSVSIENDPQTISVHRKNLPKSPLWEKDIFTLSGEEISHVFEFKHREVDGVIGGPPCQGFSFIGRRDACDPRNHLFIRFFDIVSDVLPKFFLAENVLGILSKKNTRIVSEALSKVEGKYEIFSPIRLVASEFGVPTTRERVFFFGYLQDELNRIQPADFVPKNIKMVNVGDALEGLPKSIDPHWIREEDGWSKIDKNITGEFGLKLYGQIPDNVGDGEAIRRFKEYSEVSGCLGTRHTEVVLQRYSKIEPGKCDSISKSYRLDNNGFCPTLRAGTTKELGSYQAVRPLHPSENRVITPREAARLQGYPDWFQFHPTKWHSFRQIGNSVSPILAEHILRVIRSSLA